MGEIADEAEAAAEVLQADVDAGIAHPLAEGFQLGGRGQVTFVHLQGHELAVLRMGLEHGQQAVLGGGIAQGGGGKAEGQRGGVQVEVVEGVFEHRQVEAGGPAQALYPGQEAAGGDGFALGVEQASEDLVVQQAAGVGALHHGLEVELQFAFVEGLVDPAAPVVQALAGVGLEVVEALPVARGVALGLSQGLVGTGEDVGRVLSGAEGGDAQVGHRGAVAGAGGAQVFQGGTEHLGEAVGAVALKAGCEEGELATAVA